MGEFNPFPKINPKKVFISAGSPEAEGSGLMPMGYLRRFFLTD